jgi:hypothetical protein
MRTWTWCLACAAVLAMVGPGTARAAEMPTAEKTVPLEATGRLPLDLELAPMRFLELVLQGPPADPAAVAARPPEERFELAVVAVASNVGKDDAEFRMTVRFLDAQGATVLECSGKEDQDEGVTGETHDVCKVRGALQAWARVTQVRFEVQITELE